MKSKGMKRAVVLVLLGALLIAAGCGREPEETPPEFEDADYELALPIYAMTEEKTEAGTVRYSDFIFDKYGRVLGKKAEGDVAGEYSYLYDEKGLLEEETFQCDDGYLTLTYEYNEDGLLDTSKESSDFSETNGHVSYYKYTMDENGLPAQTTVTDYRGEWQTTVIESRFDAYKNPVEETRAYYKYGVTAQADKTETVENTYDECGHLIRAVVKTEDEDGQLQEKVRTYSYECVDRRTISSKAEMRLTETGAWKAFDESAFVPQPDSCSKKLRFVQKEDTADGAVYHYQILKEDEGIEYQFYPGQYLEEYEEILMQLWGLTLETQENGDVLIMRDGQTLATLHRDIDAQANRVFTVRFSTTETKDEES